MRKKNLIDDFSLDIYYFIHKVIEFVIIKAILIGKQSILHLIFIK